MQQPMDMGTQCVPGAGPIPTGDLVRICRRLNNDKLPQYRSAIAELRRRWATPLWLLMDVAARCRVPFPFALDLCAEADTTAGKVYFGPGSILGEDGLTAELPEKSLPSVWCNPPWADCGPWVRRADKVQRAGAPLVVLCVPNYSSAEWWDLLIEREAKRLATRWEVRGRVDFEVHPLVLEAGLYKASSPTEHTVIWALHGRRKRLDRSPIVARGRSSQPRVQLEHQMELI